MLFQLIGQVNIKLRQNLSVLIWHNVIVFTQGEQVLTSFSIRRSPAPVVAPVSAPWGGCLHTDHYELLVAVDPDKWCDIWHLTSDNVPMMSPVRGEDRLGGVTEPGGEADCEAGVWPPLVTRAGRGHGAVVRHAPHLARPVPVGLDRPDRET